MSMARAWLGLMLLTACDAPADRGGTAVHSSTGPDAAPVIDAADDGTDAGLDAAPPASPRIDAAFGSQCGKYNFGRLTPMTVLADGTILSCSNDGKISLIGSVQVCRPDGTSTSLAIDDTAWACYLLSDRRVIVRHSKRAIVVSAHGEQGGLDGATPFGDAYDVGDTIYVTSGHTYDTATLAAKPAPPVTPPKPLASCLPSSTGWWHILRVTDGITWAHPYTGQPDPAHPIVPFDDGARLLVEDDCSIVVVDPAPVGTPRTVRVYDRAGTSIATFPLTLAGEAAMIVDHRGGLVLSFPSTPTADLTLARIDLATGALDAAFGVGGIAQLDWPAYVWHDDPDGSYGHVAMKVVGADGAGNLAVAVETSSYLALPHAFFGGANYVRVLVDH